MDRLLGTTACLGPMLAILDCCFAGAFRWASVRYLSLVPERLHQEHYAWFVRDPADHVRRLRPARARRCGRALGLRQEVSAHSPFARALLDGLAGDADCRGRDGKGDGVITATELHLCLCNAHYRLQHGPKP